MIFRTLTPVALILDPLASLQAQKKKRRVHPKSRRVAYSGTNRHIRKDVSATDIPVAKNKFAQGTYNYDNQTGSTV